MRITIGACMKISDSLVIPTTEDGRLRDPSEFIQFEQRTRGVVAFDELLEIAHQAAQLLSHPTALNEGSPLFRDDDERLLAVSLVLEAQAHASERLRQQQYRA